MLPPPNGWEEFEEITKSAVELKFQNNSFTMHGRQGQKQNGVDIYGFDELGRQIGIQCKLTTKTLNQQLITTEIHNAEEFSPPLSALFIATTSLPDVNLQRYARDISQERLSNGKFPICLLFWRDIVQDLSRDLNTIKRHYPQLIQENTEQTQEQDLRKRDIDKLTSLLEFIDIERIPHDIEMAPKCLHINFINQSDYFQNIRSNPTFFIHDVNLRNTLFSWLDKWYEIICNSRLVYEYNHHTKQINFPTPMDFFRSDEEQKIFENLTRMYIDYHRLLHEFTSYIHQNYQEIDLHQTSIKARKWLAGLYKSEI